MSLRRLAFGNSGDHRLPRTKQALRPNPSDRREQVQFEDSCLQVRRVLRLAHDREIQAPIDEGKIDSAPSPSVELRIDSRKRRVLDPEIPVDKRAEIQQTMEGNAVLDAEIRSFSCCSLS